MSARGAGETDAKRSEDSNSLNQLLDGGPPESMPPTLPLDAKREYPAGLSGGGERTECIRSRDAFPILSQ